MNKVVHCKRAPYDVYIGRPSEWGNPYVLKSEQVRGSTIDAYREYLWREVRKNPEEMIHKLRALEGKTLGCWCHPKPCHGNVIALAVEWALKQ